MLINTVKGAHAQISKLVFKRMFEWHTVKGLWGQIVSKEDKIVF